MTRCEVCGKKIERIYPGRRFCSKRCESIARTKEYQIVSELRKTGKVSLAQLIMIVERNFGKWNLDERLAEVIRVARETGEVEVIVQ